MKQKLVLIDAHAIIHRAYHALPDFASSKGEPTGALFGLSTMILSIIKQEKPDFLIGCFDLPKPTYRHVAYEEYKAGRKKADDALVSQIIKSKEIFDALSIPMYSLEGFEADDMLGTIVEQLKNDKDTNIVIASGDMDTLQLVDGERVKVFTLKKGIKDTVMYGEKEVFERFGFYPKHIPDYKGLRGDPSDNIIGIKGIGEKGATSLIKEFGTLEEMYEALEKGELQRFKKIGISDRVLTLIEQGKEDALFSKMLATIRRDAPIDFVLPQKKWIETFDTKKIIEKFNEFEFRSLVQRVGEFNGQSVSEEKTEIKNIDKEELKKVLIGLWLLDSSKTNPTVDDLFFYTKTEDFSKAKEIIYKEIKNKELSFVFENVEIPIIPIVEEMENNGVKIDTKALEKLSKEYHEELEEVTNKIYALSGEEFNVASPKQLSYILFEKMGLKVKGIKKTGTGAISTKESELEKLKGSHEIIDLILIHRELSKLLGTYIDNLPPLLDKSSRLHAKFLQTGTTTGRMSSESPNLQNIPIKSERGRNIRDAFVPEEGNLLVAFDYSQIELRIAAILSGDSKLIDIFKKGEDVHASVASRVFSVSLDQVDKEMRRKAKVINFGILYGMGVNALRQNLKGTKEEAEQFYMSYFSTFGELALYIEKTKNEARKTGYTKTLFGRRRYFEGINSKLPFVRASAERMAINAPIQGTQADILKMAMKKIDEYLVDNNIKKEAKLILQIHDEVIYEMKKDLVSIHAPKIKNILESIVTSEITKGVPVIANASAGDSWGNLKTI